MDHLERIYEILDRLESKIDDSIHGLTSHDKEDIERFNKINTKLIFISVGLCIVAGIKYFPEILNMILV